MLSDNLKSSLPFFISSTQLFTELFVAEGQELDGLDADLADLQAQFNVDTATWALDFYEKELGIPTDYTKPLAYRASVIKSKWRGGGKLNSTLIKTVCDAFTNGNTEVMFDGTIKVKFNSILGIPPNLDDLKAAVHQIKPAYLELVYLFSYLLISEIDKTMTIDQLESTPLNEFAGGV
ncbi:putative phage tail protein [Desulfosporosinus sp. SB140]|uniref:putative phage tail protein n=1 Tax=Desulfosporosinus paludis TaxID=3115649 RepID=UPI00388DDA04